MRHERHLCLAKKTSGRAFLSVEFHASNPRSFPGQGKKIFQLFFQFLNYCNFFHELIDMQLHYSIRLFFDAPRPETERQIFVKLRKIAETEKYEIYRTFIVSIEFRNLQKSAYFHQNSKHFEHFWQKLTHFRRLLRKKQGSSLNFSK